MFAERICEERFGGDPVVAVANPWVDHVAADRQASALLPSQGSIDARRTIASWPAYSPTPLVALPGLAAQLGIEALWLKDEGPRFGLGSFKALGGAYAVSVAVDAAHGALTLTSATDGNHGRSVAWGAQRAGCRCVIYLHEGVSEQRERAIRAYGADIVRTPGNYDDSARRCAQDAASHGWLVVSDTAGEDGYGAALDVMQGYGVLVDELIQQLGDDWPTHVLVQAGCGGLAAAVRAHLAALRGTRSLPFFVVVEPDAADCLYQSAVAGTRQVVDGGLETIMAGLAVGEVSVPAWDILRPGADAFVVIPDELALEAMRVLANPVSGDQPVVAGETGAAGLGGLLGSQIARPLAETMRLDSRSRVVVINTESDTDPESYAAIVGRPAGDVRGRTTCAAPEKES